MIRSSITISLVQEARGGPFVFWDDLERSCAQAAELGFDAVELFLPSGSFLKAEHLTKLLGQHGLRLAALGTGAGWVLRRLHLSHPDPAMRAGAREFIGGIIDLAGACQASAIVGSMQGRFDGEVSREQALSWLAEGLVALSERAAGFQVPLLYEPLNRYETNLINRMSDACALVDSLGGKPVKILADLFHMNIEEESVAKGLREAGGRIGHVHFVDSNRRAAGLGHLNFNEIATVLDEVGFQGYASAEALPYPSSEEAARQTLKSFRTYFKTAKVQ